MICPRCQREDLIEQPTVGDNFRTQTCYGQYLKADGKESGTRKCGYIAIMREKKLVYEYWNGKESKELSESLS